MSSCPAGRKPQAGGMKRPRRFPGRRAAPGPAYGENSRGAPAASAIGAPEMRRVGGGHTGLRTYGWGSHGGVPLRVVVCRRGRTSTGRNASFSIRKIVECQSFTPDALRPFDPSTGSGSFLPTPSSLSLPVLSLSKHRNAPRHHRTLRPRPGDPSTGSGSFLPALSSLSLPVLSLSKHRNAPRHHRTLRPRPGDPSTGSGSFLVLSLSQHRNAPRDHRSLRLSPRRPFDKLRVLPPRPGDPAILRQAQDNASSGSFVPPQVR